MKKKQKGFTLLELLVVIGIIAILLGFAAVSFAAAQKRSRDVRRREDLKAMQNALEQYNAAEGFVYPDDCDDAASYMQGSWPVDPGGSLLGYEYTACAVDSYCICVDLETDDVGNSSDNACSWGSGAGADYYCVANLQ